ncbi:MAG TPA: hypothetical protein VK870_02020, partial [Ignavibacteriaceae bacterium]|nr:hypothetical protein [Ignavibacteriaceae bacterium]
MIKLIFAFLFLLMASSSTIFPQQKFFFQNKKNISQEPADISNIFTRMEVVHQIDKETITYYPINDGDFWEYIVEDTTTVFGVFYEGLYFSVVREVLNDTTMTNGLDYKIIRWDNIANSVSYDPWYDYHRVDTSGNVRLFFNYEDHLLFDVNSPKGTTYPSHLTGKFWRIEDRYNVIGFGDTLSAIDYALYEGSIIRETYTLVESFGIINYQKRKYNLLPEGYFWGAVINNVKYGTLIAKKEEVDWKEFYPLHLGNYWVYEGSSGPIPVLRTVRIIGDTTLQDGYEYKIAEEVHYTPSTDVQYYFTRIDSIGRIWIKETWAAEPTVRYQLSINVGDMYESYLFDFYWRIENKYIDIFLYPDVANHQISFSKGLGITWITGEMTYEYLRGALINGTLYGDTIGTSIRDDIES